MIYEFQSRIRYSEVDQYQKLTLPGIINYFQDCSTFHSEHINLGLSYMEREKKVWVLSAWQIVIDKLPVFGDEVIVQTWPYAFKGFMGSRNFTLLDKERNILVKANSIWSFLDLKTGGPAKPSSEQIEGYALEEKLPMEYAPRKIPFLWEKACEKAKVQVVKHQLDTNHHMNNGQYVQLAWEYLPENFKVKQIRVEYKKAAVLHDVILPVLLQEDTTCTVALCDENKNPYAVIAFDG